MTKSEKITEKEALEIIERLGKSALFLSCSDHILDTIEIFKGDAEYTGTLRFYASGLAKESSKAIERYYGRINGIVEKQTWAYKDMQEQHLIAFIGASADPGIHKRYIEHLKAFNEKEGLRGIDDEEFLRKYSA